MGQITTSIVLNDKMSGVLRRINRNVQSLERTVNRVNTGIGNSSRGMDRLNASTMRVRRTTSSLLTATRGVTTAVGGATSAMHRFNSAALQSRASVRGISSELNSLLAKFAGVMTLRVAVNAADTITSAENKYNYINGGDAEETQETIDKIYSSALRARSSYGDAMTNVSKMIVNAGQAFDDNIDKAVMFNELMEKSYVIGGASEQQRSSSMYQLIQGLGANTLQGDELRSVREGAMIAYNVIEDYAQALYDTQDPLKDLASEGLITAEVVTNAMLMSADKINSAFENTQMTIGQMWTMLKTKAMKAFEPVFQQMSRMFNDPAFQQGLDGLISSFVVLSQIALAVVSGIVKAFNWLTEALGGTENMAWVVATAFAVLGVIAVISATVSMIAWIIANWPIVLAITLVVALMAIFMKFAAQVVGSVYVIGAVISNVIRFLGNLIWAFIFGVVTGIQWLLVAWDNFCIFLQEAQINSLIMMANAWEGFKNWISTLVSNIVKAFYNGFVTILQKGISMVQGLMNAFVGLANFLNKILGVFGIEIDTSGIKSVVSKLADTKKALGSTRMERADLSDAWNKGFNSYNKIELPRNEYPDVGAAIAEGFNTYDYKNLGDAWNAGSEKGQGWRDSLANMIGSFTDKELDHNWNDLMKGATGGTGNPADLLSGSGIPKGVDKIGKNTGKMADSTDLMVEELKYLRDVAEQEVINRFTTAEIKVEMNNNNKINSNMDLDGIVTHLSTTLREELMNVAESTHL